jgi:hypothetical protein
VRNLLSRSLALGLTAGLLGAICLSAPDAGWAQKAKAKTKAVEVTYPPKLPDGKEVVTDTSEEFLKPAETLKPGVLVATTPPTVDFAYYPGQTYPGNPWSNWGDSLAVNGKYYASIGDHWSVDSRSANKQPGNAFVYEYDPATKKFRLLADVRQILKLEDGHYSPGKIHGRLDMGDDGWIYFSTHRGSTRVTTDQYHYKGDWIFRCNPETGQAEVVVQAPVPKHCIPNSVLDPKRLIFYGGTAAGSGGELEGIQFFAYDCRNKKLLYSGPDGPSRYMIFAKSTGRVYYTQGKADGVLMRYDPDKGGPPVQIPGTIGIRAATQETPQGIVYTVSTGQGKGADPIIYAFNTKTEEIKELGSAIAASNGYIASLDADPTGRYLYYVPGAHGGAERDGSPVIQYDVQRKQKKVIAFLEPYYTQKYGCTLKGTYSTAVDPKGDKLYITWNASRGSRVWDCCALTVIHIPESERRP